MLTGRFKLKHRLSSLPRSELKTKVIKNASQRCLSRSPEWSTGSSNNGTAVRQSTSTELTTVCSEAPVSRAKLMSFLAFVKPDRLSPEEQLIHDRHVEALENLHEVYSDPKTGYDVITRLAHLRRGQCCGNACRHCPYGQESVPNELKTKKYNSAFYI